MADPVLSPEVIIGYQHYVPPSDNAYDPEFDRQRRFDEYLAQLASQQSPYGEGSYENPPADAEDLPEVVVSADPVPLEELSNDELWSIGTDSALLVLELRGAFGVHATDGYGNYWPDAGDPLLETFLPPPPPVYVEPIVQTVLRTLALPFILPFALLFPQPTGPRELDEAPRAPPRRPPVIPPAPLDPILPPNWNDIAYEPNPIFGPGDLINPSFRTVLVPLPDVEFPPDYLPGRVLPISDYPGLLADPGELPEMPLPDIAFPGTRPGVVPRDVPDRLAPDPFADPFTVPFIGPSTDPFPEPGIWAEPGPRPGDRVIPDPGLSPFPYAPGLPAPGTPPRFDFLDPQIPDPFLNPFGNPLEQPGDMPDPFQADPCNCGGSTSKKKKKKKKKDRKVCYKGSYEERSRSLLKRRREQIPCR